MLFGLFGSLGSSGLLGCFRVIRAIRHLVGVIHYPDTLRVTWGIRVIRVIRDIAGHWGILGDIGRY